MTHPTLGRVAGALAVALALVPGPALAGGLGPLTGSWALSLRCKGAAAGEAQKLELAYFLPIQHVAATGLVSAGAGDTGALGGLVVFDASKPDRFWLTVTSCELGSPERGLALHVKGKLDADAGKAKGSAVLYDSVSGQVASCKAQLERTDANAPPVLSCP